MRSDTPARLFAPTRLLVCCRPRIIELGNTADPPSTRTIAVALASRKHNPRAPTVADLRGRPRMIAAALRHARVQLLHSRHTPAPSPLRHPRHASTAHDTHSRCIPHHSACNARKILTCTRGHPCAHDTAREHHQPRRLPCWLHPCHPRACALAARPLPSAVFCQLLLVPQPRGGILERPLHVATCQSMAGRFTCTLLCAHSQLFLLAETMVFVLVLFLVIYVGTKIHKAIQSYAPAMNWPATVLDTLGFSTRAGRSVGTSPLLVDRWCSKGSYRLDQ